jgi:hypothetical protein
MAGLVIKVDCGIYMDKPGPLFVEPDSPNCNCQSHYPQRCNCSAHSSPSAGSLHDFVRLIAIMHQQERTQRLGNFYGLKSACIEKFTRKVETCFDQNCHLFHFF